METDREDMADLLQKVEELSRVLKPLKDRKNLPNDFTENMNIVTK